MLLAPAEGRERGRAVTHRSRLFFPVTCAPSQAAARGGAASLVTDLEVGRGVGPPARGREEVEGGTIPVGGVGVRGGSPSYPGLI